MAIYLSLLAVCTIWAPPVAAIIAIGAVLAPLGYPILTRGQRQGPCPCCGKRLEVSRREHAVTCRACRHRILVEERDHTLRAV